MLVLHRLTMRAMLQQPRPIRFFERQASITVIADDGSGWRMADVIWVDGGTRNPFLHRVSGGLHKHLRQLLGQR